jgi:hypothetical protein
LSTTSHNGLRSLLLIAALFPVVAIADDAETEFGGHVKTRALFNSYPGDSIFDSLTGSSAGSLETELRLSFSVNKDAWSFDSAWQLYGAYGDRVELLRDLSSTALPGVGHLPNDERRLMNLTDVLRDDGKSVAVHRLDRLSVGYAKDNIVLRLGRQALTWGNGLIFSPMDIVNPFDPTTVDTEFKFGDDMFYGQFLRGNGDDIEVAHVFRRDPATGDPESYVATTAIKYHGFAGEAEYDLLLAENHDDVTVGIGGNRSVGGAVVHGDVVWADTPSGSRLQLVTNLSYSWVWGGKNMSGVIEYYFSEFGQKSGNYDIDSLTQNVELTKRLERGEVFTLGRNYLAGGVTIELTPLWMLTPNLFANLDDGSALLQVVTRNSLSDNAEFLGALNLPIGPSGTEFGGIEAGMPGVYFSSDFSLFAQFAWYF